MSLHDSTFDYYKPTDTQIEAMAEARQWAKEYAHALEHHLPDGPDKTYVLRKLRELAMWVNIALTRHADGSPRED